MPLSTSSVVRFIRELFSLKWRIVLWHLHSVEILSQQWSPATAKTHILSPLQATIPHPEPSTTRFTTNSIHTARQIPVTPSTAAQVLVATPASELLVMQPHFKCLTRQRTLTERKIMDVSPRQPFYIIINNLSHIAQHLPKHMVVAYTEPAPIAIYHCRQNPPNLVSIGTRKVRKSRATSNITIFPNSDSTPVAVCYKALIAWAKKMEQHVDVKNKDVKRFLHGWPQEIGIANIYGAYRN